MTTAPIYCRSTYVLLETALTVLDLTLNHDDQLVLRSLAIILQELLHVLEVDGLVVKLGAELFDGEWRGHLCFYLGVKNDYNKL